MKAARILKFNNRCLLFLVPRYPEEVYGATNPQFSGGYAEYAVPLAPRALMLRGWKMTTYHTQGGGR